MRFEEFEFPEEIQRALDELGLTEPTPIQEQAIPLVRQGRDLIGKAETGTGKTLAFGLPTVERIDATRVATQALILLPTRELAQQLAQVLNEVGMYRGVRCALVVGGQPIAEQVHTLRGGAQIVVGTPGRVLEMATERILSLAWVETVILDEADRMLDMGFIDEVGDIMDRLPKERQTLLFSATIPPELQRLHKRYMHDPVFVSTAKEELSTVDEISQFWIPVRTNKMRALIGLLERNPDETHLVFCNTKRDVEWLDKELWGRGFHVYSLHGDHDQDIRFKVLERFREGGVHVLIATDVASRGLDVEHIARVINFSVPNDPELYVHRIGRTGRAGRSGTVITLVDAKERRDFQRILKQTGWDIQRATTRGLPGEPGYEADAAEQDEAALWAADPDEGDSSGRDRSRRGRSRGGRGRGGSEGSSRSGSGASRGRSRTRSIPAGAPVEDESGVAVQVLASPVGRVSDMDAEVPSADATAADGAGETAEGSGEAPAKRRRRRRGGRGRGRGRGRGDGNGDGPGDEGANGAAREDGDANAQDAVDEIDDTRDRVDAGAATETQAEAGANRDAGAGEAAAGEAAAGEDRPRRKRRRRGGRGRGRGRAGGEASGEPVAAEDRDDVESADDRDRAGDRDRAHDQDSADDDVPVLEVMDEIPDDFSDDGEDEGVEPGEAREAGEETGDDAPAGKRRRRRRRGRRGGRDKAVGDGAVSDSAGSDRAGSESGRQVVASPAGRVVASPAKPPSGDEEDEDDGDLEDDEPETPDQGGSPPSLRDIIARFR